MPRIRPETALQWVPTADQNAVLDWLAMGYSQQAASRQTEVPQPTIWKWLNEREFSALFREEVQRRSALFQENLSAIEEQQKLQATATFGKVLSGEVRRDSSGNAPLEYLAAVELLRATRWKQIAGEPHRKFGDTA